MNNATDCIIDPNGYDEADTGIDATLRNRFTTSAALPAGRATNASVDWENNNVFCACDVPTLDSNLNNEYVKHLFGRQKDANYLYNLHHSISNRERFN